MDKEPKFNFNEELLQEYKGKLWTLVDKFVSDGRADEIAVLLANKGKELKNLYPHVENYVFWHVLAGSTIFDNAMIHTEDFPGNDSVALFIDELANSEGLG